MSLKLAAGKIYKICEEQMFMDKARCSEILSLTKPKRLLASALAEVFTTINYS